MDCDWLMLSAGTPVCVPEMPRTSGAHDDVELPRGLLLRVATAEEGHWNEMLTWTVDEICSWPPRTGVVAAALIMPAVNFKRR